MKISTRTTQATCETFFWYSTLFVKCEQYGVVGATKKKTLYSTGKNGEQLVPKGVAD